MATGVRHKIITATTLAAVLLYLDRNCIAEIAKLPQFREDLNLTDAQVGTVMSAFYFTYAISQVPAGWLSDRFGIRKMFPLYVCIWSLCTLATGWVSGFVMLVALRMLFGIVQAGCYPTAGSLIRRWVPEPRRGTASSIVSFGGRIGGAIAPLLTAALLADVLPWRTVLLLYGSVGCFVALYFVFVFREYPDEHPGCDEEERRLIRGATPIEPTLSAADFPPIMPLIQSLSMWLMCGLQYGINVGWVFLVTWLPRYLQDVKHIDPKLGGMMSTIVLGAGVVGMLCGGPLTDYAVTRLGSRWGRTLPMLVCYSTAVVVYLMCMRLESPIAFIAAASIIAFVTDLSVPSIWAYMQDVGGKNTAAFFGWGNMWGNLGAATTPLLVPIVLEQWDSNKDWHEAFWIFSAGYLLAAVCALFIRVKHRIT